MKKRLLPIFLVLLMLPCLLFPVKAEAPFVTDNAGLFTGEEASDLANTISQLHGRYGVDIVILTEESLNGQRPQDHADSYYDAGGYADDGILFLISMEERDWYISTAGDAIYALTDYGIEQLGDAVVPYLSMGNYYAAFDTFLSMLPMYLDAFQEGRPIDGYADYDAGDYRGDREQTVYYSEPYEPNFVLSLLVGFVAGGVTLAVMGAMMNTKRPQKSASVYMNDHSYRLTRQQDLFLYSRVSKVRRQQNNPSGGGSSVHRSGGGRSHGGGGGKF